MEEGHLSGPAVPCDSTHLLHRWVLSPVFKENPSRSCLCPSHSFREKVYGEGFTRTGAWKTPSCNEASGNHPITVRTAAISFALSGATNCSIGGLKGTGTSGAQTR